MRDAGDLGQAAEQLLAATAGERAPTCRLLSVVDTLHQIAGRRRARSQGRKLELLAGLLGVGNPAGGSLRAASGDRQPATGDRHADDPGRAGRRCTPAVAKTGRCWSGRTTSAAISAWSRATLASGTRPRSRTSRVQPGEPSAGDARPAVVRRPAVLDELGGQCTAEYKYDGMRTAGTPHWRWARLSCSPGARSASAANSPTWLNCCKTGLVPREAILEGEVVGLRRRGRRAAPLPGGHVPAPETRNRRSSQRRARRLCSASSCYTPTVGISRGCPIWIVGRSSRRRSRCRTGSG